MVNEVPKTITSQELIDLVNEILKNLRLSNSFSTEDLVGLKERLIRSGREHILEIERRAKGN